MKRLLSATLTALALGSIATFAAYAGKPPSGDSNPGDRHNTTVDTSQIVTPNPRRN